MNDKSRSNDGSSGGDFEKRVAEAIEIRMREANSWGSKPFYVKLGLILQNCMLAVSFALSVWQGLDRHRADKANIATAQIANKSLAVAIDSHNIAAQSLETAEKGNNLTAKANNLTAIANNLTAIDIDMTKNGILFNIYTYCLDHPQSTLNFTTATGTSNCTKILSSPFPIPSAQPTLTSSASREISPRIVGWTLIVMMCAIGATSTF